MSDSKDWMYTSGKPTHFFGKICIKHPELNGKRYTHRYRCVQCHKESGKEKDKEERYQIWFEQKGQYAKCFVDIPWSHACTDHVKAISKGGTHERSNKRVLCTACNTAKHNYEDGEWEHKIKPTVWYKDLMKKEPACEINPC